MSKEEVEHYAKSLSEATGIPFEVMLKSRVTTKWAEKFKAYKEDPIPTLEEGIKRREKLIERYKRLIAKHEKSIKRLKKTIETKRKS